jgi:molybdenum cofactor biosynthesis enzyme MoaA
LEFQTIRETRSTAYDPYDYEFVDFSFDKGSRKVYANANLSIFVDNYCNADCQFCVAQLRFENQGQWFHKTKIEDDDIYISRLREVLKYLKPLNLSVSLTGGEPTKCPRILRILEAIDDMGYRKRVLTTNGSGLYDTIKSNSLLNHLIMKDFSHLNISKAHYDDDVNRAIMRYKNKDYVDNQIISNILKDIKPTQLQPRMSCALLKEGISTVSDMIEYMKYYKSIGADTIIFRELMNFDEYKMVNEEKKNYCNANKIYLDDIWVEVDNDVRFVPIKNLLGYYYYVEVYQFEDIVMVTESADLKRLYSTKAQYPEITFELVFHPSGILSASWVDNEDILLDF